MRQALGAPALAIGATFLAFGAAVAEAALSLTWSLIATGAVYGMARQLVLLQGRASAVCWRRRWRGGSAAPEACRSPG